MVSLGFAHSLVSLTGERACKKRRVFCQPTLMHRQTRSAFARSLAFLNLLVRDDPAEHSKMVIRAIGPNKDLFSVIFTVWTANFRLTIRYNFFSKCSTPTIRRPSSFWSECCISEIGEDSESVRKNIRRRAAHNVSILGKNIGGEGAIVTEWQRTTWGSAASMHEVFQASGLAYSGSFLAWNCRSQFDLNL